MDVCDYAIHERMKVSETLFISVTEAPRGGRYRTYDGERVCFGTCVSPGCGSTLMMFLGRIAP